MTNLPHQGEKGIVFNIQKYSLHDGPGIRTIIFLKGCSLRCDWCSNPESQALPRQLAYNPAKCLTIAACSRCRGICPRGALSFAEGGKVVRDSAACDDCLECAGVCPTRALNVYGYEITVEAALQCVEEDEVFYARSGGGLTLSGGEPLVQAEFAIALLCEARKRRIDTAIETCGNVPWPVLKQAAPWLNSIYYDIKSIDTKRHLQATGEPNARLLNNLVKLRRRFPKIPITVRTPVIPSFNDTEKEIAAIVDFIKEMPNTRYELLAYHRLGTPKYEYLGQVCPMATDRAIAKRHMDDLQEFARQRMKNCRSPETIGSCAATP